MSNTIGALNYRLSADVAGFQKGMVLSRSEMRLVNREMAASRSDAERYADKLDVLEKAFQAGAVGLDEYHRTQVRLRSETAEAKASAAAHADELKRAADLTRKLMTAEERLAEERKELEQLRPKLSDEAYARAIEDLNKRLPETIEAEKKRAAVLAAEAEEIKKAADLTRKLMTAEERLAEERAEVEQLRPRLGDEAYARAIEDLNKRLPANVQAEKERAAAMKETEALQREAAQLTASLTTEEERHVQALARLEKLKPHLSQEAYNRALQEELQKSPQAVAAQERLEQARRRQERRQQLLNKEMEEGRQITRSVETASERYAREMASLDKHLRRGTISQETYNRKVREARAAQRQATAGMLSQVPVVGRLSGLVGGMHPALMLAVGGFATLSVGMRAAQAVIRAVTAGVKEQMQAVDQAAKFAATIGTTSADLTAIRLAASEFAGMDHSATDMALQRMTRRLAEAATGGGEAKDAIKQLGLNAQDLSRQDPAIVFRRVADEIRKVKDPAEQMRLTYKLFDSEGVRMVNLLREGSAAIDESKEAAIALGIAFSGWDAEKIQASNDAMGRAQASLDGVYIALSADVAPGLQVASTLFGNLTMVMRNTWLGGDSLAQKLGAMGGALVDLKDIVAGVGNADWNQLKSGLNFSNTGSIDRAIAGAAEKAAQAAKEKEEKLKLARETELIIAKDEAAERKKEAAEAKRLDGIRDRIKRERELNIELTRGKGVVEDLKLAEEGATIAQRRELQNLIRANEAIREKERRTKEAAAAAERAAKAAEQERKSAREAVKERGKQLMESLRTPFEVMVDELTDAMRLRDVGAIDERTFRREEQAAQDRFRESNRKEQRESPAIPTATRGSRELYDVVTKTLSQARDQGQQIQRDQLAQQIAMRAAMERAADAAEKQNAAMEGV